MIIGTRRSCQPREVDVAILALMNTHRKWLKRFPAQVTDERVDAYTTPVTGRGGAER